jgi:hypothetical protein
MAIEKARIGGPYRRQPGFWVCGLEEGRPQLTYRRLMAHGFITAKPTGVAFARSLLAQKRIRLLEILIQSIFREICTFCGQVQLLAHQASSK